MEVSTCPGPQKIAKRGHLANHLIVAAGSWLIHLTSLPWFWFGEIFQLVARELSFELTDAVAGAALHLPQHRVK